MVSIPFGRVEFNKAERRFGVVVKFCSDAKLGFVIGAEGDGFICVFTIVGGGLFVVADVAFSFASARICATRDDILLSDNDERLGVTVVVVVGFVEAKDTLVDVESVLLFTDGTWFAADLEAS